MSVALYAYDSERCDGDFCPLECKDCPKNPENGYDVWGDEDEEEED